MTFSLKKKSILLISIFSILVGAAGLFLSDSIINNIVDKNYESKVSHLAQTIAGLVDGDKIAKFQKKVVKIYHSIPEDERVGSEKWGTPEFEAYLENFNGISDMKEFTETHDLLQQIQDDNDISSAYLMYVDVDTKTGVYLLDAAHEDPCQPGVFDPIYESNYPSLEDPERGFPPYITDTEEYGWLITSAMPVHDSKGNVITYAAVDASMSEMKDKLRTLFFIMLGVFLLLAVLISLAGSIVINRYIVRPIRDLSTAARNYCESDTKSAKIGFSRITVNSHDEIRELADSMKMMEYELNEYISNLLRTREQLVVTRERAELMSDIANKDALTGLRNKRAYEVDTERIYHEILDGTARFGIVMVDMNYLKKMNDTYGHDKGDSALQKVSRMICNVFKHSPVYRFGGDEFVVIIEHTDYRDVNNLIRSFRELVSSDTTLSEWERVSAAIGFAIYDENRDRNVDDVFKRADDMMYLNKKQIKGEA